MHLLIIIAACLGLWLLFPKGFAHMVGGFVAACVAGFLWGLVLITLMCMNVNPTWNVMGALFVGLQVAGIIVSFIVVRNS